MAIWIHTWSTFALTGLIWFVQIVHYPSMEAYERRWFTVHARRHAKLTGYVAAPIMLVELATGFYLLFTQFQSSLISLGMLLVVLIWISTFFVQVPLHARLQRQYDPAIIKRLVFSNWIRTGFWSLRSLLLILFLTTNS